MSQITKIPPLRLFLDRRLEVRPYFINDNILGICGMIAMAANNVEQCQQGIDAVVSHSTRRGVDAGLITARASQTKDIAKIDVCLMPRIDPNFSMGSEEFGLNDQIMDARINPEARKQARELWDRYLLTGSEIRPEIKPTEVQAFLGCTAPLLKRVARRIPRGRFGPDFAKTLEQRAKAVAQELGLPEPEFGRKRRLSADIKTP